MLYKAVHYIYQGIHKNAETLLVTDLSKIADGVYTVLQDNRLNIGPLS